LFHHLNVGVIDEDFCGNLSVLLFNHSENSYIICRGDKSAKVMWENLLSKIGFGEKKQLDATWSSARGFGCTGQN